MLKSGLHCTAPRVTDLQVPWENWEQHSSSPGIQIGARSKQMMHPIPPQHAWRLISWLMEPISLTSLEQYASVREGSEKYLELRLWLLFSCKKEQTTHDVLPELYIMERPCFSLYPLFTIRSATAAVWYAVTTGKHWLCNDFCCSFVVEPTVCAQ